MAPGHFLTRPEVIRSWLVAELIGSGGFGQAYLAARRELGNIARVQEDTRDAWGWTLFEQLLQDLRYAGRTMGSNKTFTVLAILSLALGIGAAYMIAMWTAVAGVLFLPANGTQIAAAEADTTGTTTLGNSSTVNTGGGNATLGAVQPDAIADGQETLTINTGAGTTTLNGPLGTAGNGLGGFTLNTTGNVTMPATITTGNTTVNTTGNVDMTNAANQLGGTTAVTSNGGNIGITSSTAMTPGTINAGAARQVMVKEIREKTIVLDMNHPLAGKTLVFEVKVIEVTAGDGGVPKPGDEPKAAPASRGWP